MSQKPNEDLLVTLFNLDTAGITDEVMARTFSAMTELGWPLEDSTVAWEHAIGSCLIRYNASRQPTLTTSGRATALAVREERSLALFTARRVQNSPQLG